MQKSLILLAVLLLTACESGGKSGLDAIGTLQDFGKTASGTIHDAKDGIDFAVQTGKSMTQTITELIEDAKERIDRVQSGVSLILQGKEMIEDGVQGNGEM